MGTHPIFESDFDCLTESDALMAGSASGSESDSALKSPSGEEGELRQNSDENSERNSENSESEAEPDSKGSISEKSENRGRSKSQSNSERGKSSSRSKSSKSKKEKVFNNYLRLLTQIPRIFVQRFNRSVR